MNWLRNFVDKSSEEAEPRALTTLQRLAEFQTDLENEEKFTKLINEYNENFPRATGKDVKTALKKSVFPFTSVLSQTLVFQINERGNAESRETALTQIFEYFEENSVGYQNLLILRNLGEEESLSEEMARHDIVSTLCKCVCLFSCSKILVLKKEQEEKIANLMSELLNFILEHEAGVSDFANSNSELYLMKSFMSEENFPCHVWKDCCLEILEKAFSPNSLSKKLVQNVNARCPIQSCLSISIKLSKAEERDLRTEYYLLRCCLIIINGTYSISQQSFNEFYTLHGYDLISNLCLVDNADDPFYIKLLNNAKQLVFQGELIVPENIEVTQMQESTFIVPLPEPTCKTCVRNLQAYDLFERILYEGKTEFIRALALGYIVDILVADSSNYFILYQKEVISNFLSIVNTVDSIAQRKIFQLIEYVACSLNYVPMWELAALTSLVKHEIPKEILMMVLATCSQLLEFDVKYRHIFVLTGVFNAILEFACNTEELDKKGAQAIDCNSMKKIVDVISYFVQETIASQEISARMHKLPRLIYHVEVRPRIFDLFDCLLREGNEVSICAFNQIISFLILQANVSGDILDKNENTDSRYKIAFDVVEFLKTVTEATHPGRAIFREYKGFFHIFTVLHYLKYDETSCESESKLRINLIKQLFSLIFEQLANDNYNKAYFEKEIGYKNMTLAMENFNFEDEDESYLVFELLYNLVFEKKEIVPYFRENSKLDENNIPTIRNGHVMNVITDLSTCYLNGEKEKQFLVYVKFLLGNKTNLAKLCDAVYIETFFNAYYYQIENLEDKETEILWEIICLLVQQKFEPLVLRKIFFLYQKAKENHNEVRVLKLLGYLCESTSIKHIVPDAVLFDLKPTGISCGICSYFPNSDTPRKFPPTNGYSVMCWFKMAETPEDGIVRLLQIMDDARVYCHYCIDSKTGIPSVSIGNTTVAITSCPFKKGKWYHLAFTHHRGTMMKKSLMKMYINGFCVKSFEMKYISATSSSDDRLVCVVGTGRHQQQARDFRWYLGPMYIFDEGLADHHIRAAFFVGPRYAGNFQGQLKVYQTYDILTHESLSASNVEVSGFNLQALSTAFPTIDRIIVSFHARNFLSGLVEVEEVPAYLQHTFNNVNEGFENSVAYVINGSSVSYKNVVVKQVVRLYGTFEKVVRTTYAECLRGIGGVACSVYLIDCAETSNEILRTLELLRHAVYGHGHNASQMETEMGLQMVAISLKTKTHMLNEAIVDQLFLLGGVDCNNIMNGVIANSVVFKSLILDMDIWKSAQDGLFSYILQHLNVLMSKSHQSTFNLHRLRRLHLLQRILFMLRDESISDEISLDIICILSTLLSSPQCTAKDLERFTRFMITTLNPDSEVGDNISYEEGESTVDELNTGLPTQDFVQTKRKIFIRDEMLKCFRDILFRGNEELCFRFQQVVGLQWLLLFISSTIKPSSVLIATEIFSFLLVEYDSNIVSTFQAQAQGFDRVEIELTAHSTLIPLYFNLLSVAFGIPCNSIPLEKQKCLNVKALRACFPSKVQIIKNPEILKVIFAMLQYLHNHIATTPAKSAKSGNARHSSYELQVPKDLGDSDSGTDSGAGAGVGAGAGNPSNPLTKIIPRKSKLCHVQTIPGDKPVEEAPIKSDSLHELGSLSNKPKFLDRVSDKRKSSLPSKLSAAKGNKVENAMEIQVSFDDHKGLTGVLVGVTNFLLECFENHPSNIKIADSRLVEALKTVLLPLDIPDDLINVTLGSSEPRQKKRATFTYTNPIPGSKTVKQLEKIYDMSFVAYGPCSRYVLKIVAMKILHLLSGGSADLEEVLNLIGVVLPSASSTREFKTLLLQHVLNDILSEPDKWSIYITRKPGSANLCANFASTIVDLYYLGQIKVFHDIVIDFLLFNLRVMLNHQEQFAKPLEILYLAINRLLWILFARPDYDDKIEAIKLMLDYQLLFLTNLNSSIKFFGCVCSMLILLITDKERDCDDCLSLWRLVFLRKHDLLLSMLNQQQDLYEEACNLLLQSDRQGFCKWLDTHGHDFELRVNDIQDLFQRETKDGFSDRELNRRTAKGNNLKYHVHRKTRVLSAIRKFSEQNSNTKKGFHRYENNNFLKFRQLYLDIQSYVFRRTLGLFSNLQRERGMFGFSVVPTVQWMLASIEGPNRMRLRLCLNPNFEQHYGYNFETEKFYVSITNGEEEEEEKKAIKSQTGPQFAGSADLKEIRKHRLGTMTTPLNNATKAREKRKVGNGDVLIEENDGECEEITENSADSTEKMLQPQEQTLVAVNENQNEPEPHEKEIVKSPLGARKSEPIYISKELAGGLKDKYTSSDMEPEITGDKTNLSSKTPATKLNDHLRSRLQGTVTSGATTGRSSSMSKPHRPSLMMEGMNMLKSMEKEQRPWSSGISKYISPIENEKSPQLRSALQQLKQRQDKKKSPSRPGSAGGNIRHTYAGKKTQEKDNHTEIKDEDYLNSEDNSIVRQLEPGDEILYFFNCARITGLEAMPSLLLLCKRNIYFVDGYCTVPHNDVYEIIEVTQAIQEGIFVSIALSLTSEADMLKQMEQASQNYSEVQVIKCPYESIVEVYNRRYLLRDIAIEVFSGDGRDHLLAFDKPERDYAFETLMNKRKKETVTTEESSARGISGAASADVIKEGKGILSDFFSELVSGQSMTKQWVAGEVSNFQYLMWLNTVAGRSFNDLTQYPVFPWVLREYKSETLDLNDPKNYRDLSKPMGMQTAKRIPTFIERYENWMDPTGETPPFHYGTHYSSAMIVASYLVRLEPFTQMFLTLQGGHFDHPDRMFHSVHDAWLSASEQNTADVKELIPEFFYLPEFLLNNMHLDLGKKQSGEVLDEVVLPAWAKGDVHEFIRINRAALESDYVSNHLHEWIDLIFGYKQQGDAAREAVNCFHHLSYEGAVDIDSIEDPVRRKATVGIINNFGQTPRQVFKKPHPKRGKIEHERTLYHTPWALENHSTVMKKGKTENVIEIEIRQILQFDKQIHIAYDQQSLSPDHKYTLCWDTKDCCLRLFSLEKLQTLVYFENLHEGAITCATFADSKIIVTAGEDNVVCVWRMNVDLKLPTVRLLRSCHGHLATVNHISCSRPFSIIVSGAADNTCILWDLNTFDYVRQFEANAEITALCIDDRTGDVIICAKHEVNVYSINGKLLIRKITNPYSESYITCCGVPVKNEWDQYYRVIVTGHSDGFVKIWRFCLKDKRNVFPTELDEEVAEFSHSQNVNWTNSLQQIAEFRQPDEPCTISSLCLPSDGKRILGGDIKGRILTWIVNPNAARNVTTKNIYSTLEKTECEDCNSHFSREKGRVFCRNCGKALCNNCSSNRQVVPKIKSFKLEITCNNCVNQYCT